MGHHGRSEDILLEEEEDSGGPAAPPIASVPADGQQQHASDGSVEMVGEPRVQRRSSGEIISDEDDVSSQATAAPPNAGVPADRRQETDVESGGEQLALPQASDGAAVVPRAGSVEIVVERRLSRSGFNILFRYYFSYLI
jgi:hypothetical protein